MTSHLGEESLETGPHSHSEDNLFKEEVTTYSGVLLEKLIVTQLVKKFPTF